MCYFGEFEYENKLLDSTVNSALSFFCSFTEHKKMPKKFPKSFSIGWLVPLKTIKRLFSYLQRILTNMLLLLQTGLLLKYSLLNQDAEVTLISSLLWLRKKPTL